MFKKYKELKKQNEDLKLAIATAILAYDDRKLLLNQLIIAGLEGDYKEDIIQDLQQQERYTKTYLEVVLEQNQ